MQSSRLFSRVLVATSTARRLARKAWKNREALPWEALDRLRSTMMMARHRRLATIGQHSRIHGDGWVENPEGSPDRVVIGRRCLIRGHLFTPRHGGRIRIGDDCFVGQGSKIWSGSSEGIRIGDRVLISHEVNIHDFDSHSLDPDLRAEHFMAIRTSGHPPEVPDVASAPIMVGDDAWIGFGATVLKGVSIGEGAVVAARSVVTHDVAPWTLVAGFPARPIRELPRPAGPAGSGSAAAQKSRGRITVP